MCPNIVHFLCWYVIAPRMYSVIWAVRVRAAGHGVVFVELRSV